MKTKFTQRDYFLYLRYYEKVLKFFKKEMEEIESSGKKTLWYHGAQETLERLKMMTKMKIVTRKENRAVKKLLSVIFHQVILTRHIQ